MNEGCRRLGFALVVLLFSGSVALAQPSEKHSVRRVKKEADAALKKGDLEAAELA